MNRNFPFLKNFIFWIPGENNKGSTWNLREDGEDRMNFPFFQRAKYIVNTFKSGKIFKSLQGRGA
jgi:hypothetical protein